MKKGEKVDRNLQAGEFMTQNYSYVNIDDTLTQALQRFDESTDVLIVLDENQQYSGILTKRMIIRSGLPQQSTRVWEIRRHAVRITPTTPADECARLMLKTDVRNLPVFEKGKLVGVIDDNRMLESVAMNQFGMKPIKEFVSDEMMILSPHDSMRDVLRCFREFHISRMPVIEEGNILGIITLHDVIKEFAEIKNKQSDGFFLDHHESLLNKTVGDVMTSFVITCPLSAKMKQVIELMIENLISSVVIVDHQQHLMGIITKKDILEPLSEERKGLLLPHIQISAKLPDVDRQTINKMIVEFLEKYQDYLGQPRFYLYLTEHKETSHEQHLIYTRCRLFSDIGKFITTAKGWGVEHAVQSILLQLNRLINIKISKDRKLSKEEKKQFMDYVEIESLT